MVRVMTKQEVIASDMEKENSANNWWKELHPRDRVIVFEDMAIRLKQARCSHIYKKSDYYDGTITQCSECELVKEAILPK